MPLGDKASKFVPVRVQNPDGTWRIAIRSSRTLFDDDAKQRFLETYSVAGRMGDACRAAGITPKTARWHMESDQEFGEACLAAEETYRSRLHTHVENLVFNGTIKETFDRNGQVVSRETVYPVRLIELELKAHDERYRDKREVDMKVSGGVLVAPREAESIDDWERRFASVAEDSVEDAEVIPDSEQTEEGEG